MTDDKPKHKPSKKRTLEEVLKSLQDLIRNDFVGADEPTQEEPATATPAAPAAANPDEFNNALDTLDALITREIIEPVERARQSPPEPLMDDVAELEQLIDAEPADEIAEPPEDDAPAEAPTPPRVGKPPHTAAEEQEQFPFGELSAADVVESITIDSDSAPQALEEPTPESPATEMENPPAENTPDWPAEQDNRETAATLESGSGAPAEAESMGAHTQSARERAPDARAPADAAETPAFDSTSAEDDIPVLNEIAEAIPRDLATPLPDSSQARDIAIRVIARLNIERRKAGEPPLDMKSIERLQRILSETLGRHETANRDKSSDPH